MSEAGYHRQARSKEYSYSNDRQLSISDEGVAVSWCAMMMQVYGSTRMLRLLRSRQSSIYIYIQSRLHFILTRLLLHVLQSFIVKSFSKAALCRRSSMKVQQRHVACLAKIIRMSVSRRGLASRTFLGSTINEYMLLIVHQLSQYTTTRAYAQSYSPQIGKRTLVRKEHWCIAYDETKGQHLLDKLADTLKFKRLGFDDVFSVLLTYARVLARSSTQC